MARAAVPPSVAFPPSDVKIFLDARINFERIHQAAYAARVFKLDRMTELALRLGNPHGCVPLVHVAGTKGKGSVTAMVSRILREAGYRTGTYTSPHLIHLGERIAVDDVASTESDLAGDLAEVAPVVEAMEADAAGRGDPEGGPTFFEILTAMALVRFRRAEVDLGILECGLGGRLDSTNICRPLVGVITNIGFDHTHLLGNTLGEIAQEKGGIIKPGVPLVSGVTEDEPRRVIRELASGRQAAIRERGTHFAVRAEDGNRFTVQGTDRTGPYHYEDLSLGLLGRHQRDNAAIAVAAIRELIGLGWRIPDDAVRGGLVGARCPGRIEVVSDRPTVILDVAHNPAAIRALVDTLRESFRPGVRRAVFGTSQDKDAAAMLRALYSYFDEVLLTQAGNQPRSVPLRDLRIQAESIRGCSEESNTFSNVRAAWNAAQSRSTPDDLICVTGSFYVAGELGYDW